MPGTGSFKPVVYQGGRSRSSRMSVQLDHTDLERLIDEFSLISSPTPQAWPEIYGRQLKYALRGLHLTPRQVAGLRTWLKNHNAYCGMRRKGAAELRHRVCRYHNMMRVRFHAEFDALAQVRCLHLADQRPYWATVTQEAFFFRCHELVQGNRPSPRLTPVLSLLSD